MTATETEYDFGTKYTKQNLATRVLIEGFFGALEELVRKVDLTSGAALEVGCGEGYSTERVRRFLPRAVGFTALDVEHRLVDAARVRNPDVPITQGSIYELTQGDASVDLVMSLEVLEHLEHPEEGLRQLARVSSRWLLVSVPREPIWRAMNMARGKYLAALGNTPGHLNHWSRASFVKLVETVADVREVRTPLPWTMVLAEKRR
jgi:trans-aconitate methyltransferase